MLNMLVALCVLLIINLFLWLHIKKRKFRSLKDVPGPKPYPIIGNVFDFGFNSVDILKNLTKMCQTSQPFIKYFFFPVTYVLVTVDPEFVEFILSSPKYIKKSAGYEMMKPHYGNGVLTSEASRWFKRRKMISPTFHFKTVEGFISIFNSANKNLVETLAKHAGKEEFDIHPEFTSFSLDLICETAMGVSENVRKTTSYKVYTKTISKIHEIFVTRMFSWKRLYLIFRLSKDYKELQDALKYASAFTQSVIEDRRKLLLQNKNETETDDVGMKRKQVFLDMLLTATIDGVPLADDDIICEVNTFVSAGYETTASTLSFLMYELSRNPEIQEKVFLEIKDIIGNDKNYQPSSQDLNNMKYTELVIKEVLRFYPVPVIGRQLDHDVNYKGTLIPKDTSILIISYAMQRREDLYPNASKFDPDRFLSMNVPNNPYSYIPFSAGPRNCIGQKFAMIQIKCVISKILMTFEILPADSKYEMQLSGKLFLAPANGAYIKLKKRD